MIAIARYSQIGDNQLPKKETISSVSATNETVWKAEGLYDKFQKLTTSQKLFGGFSLGAFATCAINVTLLLSGLICPPAAITLLFIQLIFEALAFTTLPFLDADIKKPKNLENMMFQEMKSLNGEKL